VKERGAGYRSFGSAFFESKTVRSAQIVEFIGVSGELVPRLILDTRKIRDSSLPLELFLAIDIPRFFRSRDNFGCSRFERRGKNIHRPHRGNASDDRRIPELPVDGKPESKSSNVPLTAANERQT